MQMLHLFVLFSIYLLVDVVDVLAEHPFAFQGDFPLFFEP